MKAEDFQAKFGAKKKPAKYRNTKVSKPEGIFDSKLEYKHWLLLKERERLGEITQLKRQVKYELQEKFTDNCGNNVRSIEMIIDFEFQENGKLIAADTKGVATDLWLVKAKLFRKKFPLVYLRISK